MGENLIAHVIICFNTIEAKIKNILLKYINSEKEYFVEEVLLNNLIINFSTKYKLLKCIAKENGIKIKPDFHDAIHKLMEIRNSVAHSDKLNNISIVGAEYDADGSQNPVYGLDPNIVKLHKDEFVEEKLIDKIESFNEYYTKILSELEEFEKKIIN